jgi:hypothetical protein
MPNSTPAVPAPAVPPRVASAIQAALRDAFGPDAVDLSAGATPSFLTLPDGSRYMISISRWS